MMEKKRNDGRRNDGVKLPKFMLRKSSGDQLENQKIKIQKIKNLKNQNWFSKSLAFTLYKGFFRNKKRSGTSLSAWFLKKNIYLVIFY